MKRYRDPYPTFRWWLDNEVIPVENGGTGSTAPIVGNRIMISNEGAMVEAPALLNGQVLVGRTGLGPVPVTLTAGMGADGPQGPQGIQGIQGIQGEVGPAGLQGLQGVQGIPGVKGDNGDIGPIGLPGDTGAAGPQGSQGIQGDVGPQGPQGVQGIQGDVGPQGIQGVQGVPGDMGPTGPVGDVGPQGIQGDVGPAGPQGIQGDVGPVGPQGIQGDVGPAGPQGIQGDVGPAGPQGIQGDVGPAGPQGIQGDVGPAGPQGIQGGVGPAGATGAQGPAGNPAPRPRDSYFLRSVTAGDHVATTTNTTFNDVGGLFYCPFSISNPVNYVVMHAYIGRVQQMAADQTTIFRLRIDGFWVGDWSCVGNSVGWEYKQCLVFGIASNIPVGSYTMALQWFTPSGVQTTLATDGNGPAGTQLMVDVKY
jgi:Collagen triple helix repeat (20 copies)